MLWVKDCPHYTKYIADGSKKYEGRLYKGSWKEMKVGDVIEFYDDNMRVQKTIVDIIQFESFSQMYEMYGHELLPDVDSAIEAEKTYRQYFGDYTNKTIAVRLE
jgi:ASC-1-like (ASCH) protein